MSRKKTNPEAMLEVTPGVTPDVLSTETTQVLIDKAPVTMLEASMLLMTQYPEPTITEEVDSLVEQYDIEDITAKILFHKGQVVLSFIEIGRLLNEAKKQLKQLGNVLWLDWLHTRVDITERMAQRYMKLAREYPNTTAMSDLGMTKALALLVLKPNERDDFIKELHDVNGVNKNVSEMTTREVEEAVKERKGSHKKNPAKKSKEGFTFKPLMRSNHTKLKSDAPSEPEYDFNTDLEHVQARIDGMLEYLDEKELCNDIYDYYSGLDGLCRTIIEFLPSFDTIYTCINGVLRYLEYEGEYIEERQSELQDLSDKILKALQQVEQEASS